MQAAVPAASCSYQMLRWHRNGRHHRTFLQPYARGADTKSRQGVVPKPFADKKWQCLAHRLVLADEAQAVRLQLRHHLRVDLVAVPVPLVDKLVPLQASARASRVSLQLASLQKAWGSTISMNGS